MGKTAGVTQPTQWSDTSQAAARARANSGFADLFDYLRDLAPEILPADEARDLARRAQAGDAAAQARVIRSIAPFVARAVIDRAGGYLRRYLADVFAEMIRLCLETLTRYDGRVAVLSYLGTTVTHNLKDISQRKFPPAGVHVPLYLFKRDSAPDIHVCDQLYDDVDDPSVTTPAVELPHYAPGRGLAALEGLPPRERELLTLRYGLGGRAPMRLEEAARVLGLKRLAARKLEARAMGRFVGGDANVPA
jgi:DNA-directed RNA polymerase specialized sigma24 family protein